MIHVLRRTEWDSVRFYAIQDGQQFKTYELFISGIFPFDNFRPRVTENVESETMDGGGEYK
jgi:hypothetical protein